MKWVPETAEACMAHGVPRPLFWVAHSSVRCKMRFGAFLPAIYAGNATDEWNLGDLIAVQAA